MASPRVGGSSDLPAPYGASACDRLNATSPALSLASTASLLLLCLLSETVLIQKIGLRHSLPKMVFLKICSPHIASGKILEGERWIFGVLQL